MAYRVTLVVHSSSIQRDESGNLINNSVGLAKLAEMGVPDSQMSSIVDLGDNKTQTTREFDTEALANEWHEFYKTRGTYVMGRVDAV